MYLCLYIHTYMCVCVCVCSRALLDRPTIVAGTAHTAITGGVSAGIFLGYLDLSWWTAVALPLSMAHCLMDSVLYGLRHRDWIIIAHHSVLFWGHILTGRPSSSSISSSSISSQTQLKIKIKMAQHLDLRCILLSRTPP